MDAHRTVIYIHLDKGEVGMLQAEILKYWGHHFAWPTPSSGKVCHHLKSIMRSAYSTDTHLLYHQSWSLVSSKV